MTETKFTPGPWRAVRGDAFVFVEVVNIAHIGVEDGDADSAPFVVQAKPGSEGSLPHNAVLIAAAPDLYEASEPFDDLATQQAVDSPEWGDSDSVTVVVTIGALRSIKAALAKARGEA